MSDRINYLLNKAKENPNEVVSFWKFMGSPLADNSTKIYIKDTLYKIMEEGSELYGSLVYCLQSYTVDNDIHLEINWEEATKTSIESLIETYQGIVSPLFRIVLEKSDEYEPSDITKPFENDEKPVTNTSGVIVDDEVLETILLEVGVPFLTIDELEYTKDTILKLCIKPALKTFYGFFPIIKDQVVGDISAGGYFEEMFPENAYHAIAYYVLGNAGGNGGGYTSPFSYYREQVLYGGGNVGCGSGFGTGLHYNKPVPGWVGLQPKDAPLQGMQAAQAYANSFRRERVKVLKKEDGKKYATGYTTIGGTICIKWLCVSYDFDDVDLQYWPDVINLCKANVLRALGMLRSLVKSDINGAIDFSFYNQRADKLEEDVLNKWKASPTNLNLGIMRGGL